MVKNPKHNFLLTSFMYVKDKINKDNHLGYNFINLSEVKKTYLQFNNPNIDFYYTVGVSFYGYFIEVSFSDDYLKCYINYYSFNKVNFYYQPNETNEELKFFPDSRNNIQTIVIDLSSQSVFFKTRWLKKFTPLSFNNSRYIFDNSEISIVFLNILAHIPISYKIFDMTVEDLKYTTSNKNVFSILQYKSKKKFFKEINNNKIVDIPNWSLKTGSFLLNVYIKICKKTKTDSIGIVEDFFNKNHKELFLLKNEISSYTIEQRIVNRIYKSRNIDVFQSIRFSDDEYFDFNQYLDYSKTIFNRRFKECKFNFNINSFKRLKVEHDNLFKEIRKKELKKKKLLKYNYNSDYKKLISFLKNTPLKITAIKNNRELLNFADYMNNCVYSYSSAIYNNECIVFKVSYNNELHCLLITKYKTKYKIIEIKKRFNRIPNPILEEKLFSLLNQL